MKINGIEGMSVAGVQTEIANGGKFVIFQYCISIAVMTFKRASDIYFIKANDSTFGVSIGYTLTSLLLGWWGIPWGPIYTIGAIGTNLSGGKDVTKEVMASLHLAIPTVTKSTGESIEIKTPAIPNANAINKHKEKSKSDNFFDDYPSQ
jgi:hypothetical protein